jgi:hypothetical protein
MTTILFFRPNKDFAMQYASFWLGQGIPEATRRGYRVIDVIEDACTFEGLKQILEGEKVDVCIMGGHGNATVFTGAEQQIVFRACQGDEIMNGTISHFLSCSVGQELLPDMISKGAVATIGYQVDFEFMVNTAYAVEQDPYAEPFKDVTLTIIKKLLDGATLKQAWEAGVGKCNEWISKLWNKTGTDWAEVIGCLEHDRDGLIALGQQEAYVLPPRIMRLNIPQLAGLGLLFFLVTGKPPPQL